MQRQFIADLQPRDNVDEIYRVVDKQLRSNRQGNDYILLQLMDRTGQISGLRWNAGQSHYELFQKGDFLRVVGSTQLHNGVLQIIVHDFAPVPSDQVDAAHFERTSSQESEKLIQELKEILLQLQNPHLFQLAQAYLNDEAFLSRLCRAPAGIKTHHAYNGGLLKHVVDVMRLADSVAGLYPQVDRELLLMGTFLHDLGKIDELSFDGEMSYTDPGQLLGHLVQGAIELDHRIEHISRKIGVKFPEQLKWRLQHLILSHHGQLEHGSPKVPMTVEAMVLSIIDDLDAKVNQMTEVIEADRNSDSDWTGFLPNLGRKLYKPSLLARASNSGE
jgi:3'-5' exoribonuclease